MPTTYAIPDGRTVMAATTYTGNGTNGTAISNAVNGVSMQPDFVWIKDRVTANYHVLMDSVRGTSNTLFSNATLAEETTPARISSFNSNGFTLTNKNDSNTNGDTFIAWQWKANGAAVTNTSGSISSQVSANTTAGFSVVTYSANGSTGTVGHGLGVAPSMIIVKKRNAAERWCVYHTSTSNAYIYLNEVNAAEPANAQLRFGNNSSVVQPASTVFTIGSSNDVNGSSGTYVAYCWAAVPGYSAFGSYTGNASTDGPFVYLGFRPRFVITKSADATAGAGDWTIHDTSRSPYNTADLRIFANASSAESTSEAMDMNSNGFKIRATNSNCNTGGGGYIYMAFAENPFKFSNAR